MSSKQMSLPFGKTDVLRLKEGRGSRKMIYWEEGVRVSEWNGIMVGWPGQQGGKEWLEMAEEASTALQLLPCLQGQAQKSAFLGESPRCCQQLSSMPCPRVLVFGTRRAISTLPPPALSIFRHKEVDSRCCPISVSDFGPLVSALQAAWIRVTWVLRPICRAMPLYPFYPYLSPDGTCKCCSLAQLKLAERLHLSLWGCSAPP